MTDTMQMQAAINIDRKIGGIDAEMTEVEIPINRAFKESTVGKYIV